MNRSKRPIVITIRPAQSISEELATNPKADSIPVKEFDTNQAYKEEEQTLDRKKDEGIRKLKIENDLLQAQLDKITGDNKARKLHSGLIFLLVFIWLVAVLVIMFLVGNKTLFLSDQVLIALLSTTSVNVIGLLVIIANYLFNKNKST